MDDRSLDLSLICRVDRRLCALPLQHVVETLRPLPVEALTGAPPYVLGLAVIRGALVPVVDAARLLGAKVARAERFVMVIAGNRRIALAVDSVLGVRSLALQSLHAKPALLREAGADLIASIGLLDTELLLVLRCARLLPDNLVLPITGGQP